MGAYSTVQYDAHQTNPLPRGFTDPTARVIIHALTSTRPTHRPSIPKRKKHQKSQNLLLRMGYIPEHRYSAAPVFLFFPQIPPPHYLLSPTLACAGTAWNFEGKALTHWIIFWLGKPRPIKALSQSFRVFTSVYSRISFFFYFLPPSFCYNTHPVLAMTQKRML